MGGLLLGGTPLWGAEGALAFDGKDRVASLSHAEMTKSMEYPGGRGGATNT